MTRIKIMKSLVLLLAVLVLAVGSVAAAPGVVHKEITDEEQRAAEKYWTPERMRNAKPMPMPTVPVNTYPETSESSEPPGPPGSSPGAPPKSPRMAAKETPQAELKRLRELVKK